MADDEVQGRDIYRTLISVVMILCVISVLWLLISLVRQRSIAREVAYEVPRTEDVRALAQEILNLTPKTKTDFDPTAAVRMMGVITSQAEAAGLPIPSNIAPRERPKGLVIEKSWTVQLQQVGVQPMVEFLYGVRVAIPQVRVQTLNIRQGRRDKTRWDVTATFIIEEPAPPKTGPA